MIPKFLLTTLNLASIILANDTTAFRNAYDYLVKIDNGNEGCVGSLIAKDTVITTGDCINTIKPQFYDIFGKVYYHLEKLKATKIIEHPDYRPFDDLANNIALIKIDPNHSIDTFLNLDNSDSISINTKMVMTGWGIIKQNDKKTSEMKQLDMKVTNLSVCSKIASLDPVLHFCATSTKPLRKCLPNEGLPVVTKDLRTLIGISSYASRKCSNPSARFTKISKYVEWIRKYTNLNSVQVSKSGFGSGDDKSNLEPNVQYPLGRCNKAGDRVCFQKYRIGVCKDNKSAYSWNCPKDTTCKFDNGKAYCSK